MITDQVAVTVRPEGPQRDVVDGPALDFVAALHREFDARRRDLLDRRIARRAELRTGSRLQLDPESESIRTGDWQVAPPPPALLDRRCEITGPVDRKMMINAFNSGASVFMADFEDATAPSWSNLLDGHVNLQDAVAGNLSLDVDGKHYALADHPAVLFVRPRGWHLPEKHLLLDGAPASGSLVDFGLYVFHCANALKERQGGIYLYLPKLESHLEARLWNDVFGFAETSLGLDLGSIRATVLIETLPAAFEMDEILYELRQHSAGLNAGRWDYIFSIIRTLPEDPAAVLSDRTELTMTVPFMRAYTERLVSTCHRRGAHAIGGMAAFIPSRRDPEVNRVALEKVREDKRREAADGFDGTWVAHPDLVPVARAEFDAVLGERLNQLHRRADEAPPDPAALLDFGSSPRITAAGVRTNVGVGLEYLAAWLGGLGAVAINNLMEDAATSEISRSQIWQWVHHRARLDDGRVIDADLIRAELDQEEQRLRAEGRYASTVGPARQLFEQVALAPDFVDFLTKPAYEQLD